jgi:division protein CdvB (Snf7/Vps24/ESCRT-III family)
MNEDFRTEIALVKKDITQLNKVIDKLDTAIEKISEVATSLNRMIAVQESRVDTQETALGQNVEIIHERITQHREEVQLEIDKSHKKIMDELRCLRQDQQDHHQQMNERLNKLEQWRWTIIGGAIVLGFLASHLPWNEIF